MKILRKLVKKLNDWLPEPKKEITFGNLREQADNANEKECSTILETINNASLKGEYGITLKIKVNQAKYLKRLGLEVKDGDKTGYYEISW